MKKISLVIIFVLFFVFTVSAAENRVNMESVEDGGQNGSVEKEENKISFDSFQFSRIFYWSTTGTTALTGLINSFAHTGYAYQTATDFRSLLGEIEPYINLDTASLNAFIESYPVIIFGSHFFLAGFAHIPVAGGLVYGALNYVFGIVFSVFQAMPLFSLTESNALSADYYTRFNDIYDRLFDPVPYFAVGTISILLGVAEIIAYLIYNRQINKRKYPYIRKIFTFTPTSITIKLGV